MNVDEAAFYLEKHLLFRRFHDLDNISKKKTNPILDEYFPIGLIGLFMPYHSVISSVFLRRGRNT